ncbi:hypothetical protein [Halobacterium sp. BOL4-2]|uniref:hypothetical protein n=1 Tax=Halobacterium sp. BOL4-2 TaxID=2810537 RepID=UPI0019634494|nr:hypothetical protein [Halobacterium sp. BOL4-2]QRY23976.1 hypothetical protein JRZ79_06025 [Halobacterium sp. BOL4-2]
MSDPERYKIGKIDLPESELPSVEEVKSEIDALDDEFEMVRRVEDDPVSGGELEYREKGRTTYLGDSHGELSFCHFIYSADTENSIVVRNEEGEEEERNQPELVRPRVFYFENGMFAFESKQDLVDPWIPSFIGKLTDTGALDNSRIFSFNQEIMEDFYESRDKITVFKFSSLDDGEFEPDNPLAEALNELTETVESQQFSGGNEGKNLKGTSLVDEAAEKMFIEKLHGSHEDSLTMNILESGIYVVAWSESDWSEPIETGTRAEAIFNRLAPQVRRLA